MGTLSRPGAVQARARTLPRGLLAALVVFGVVLVLFIVFVTVGGKEGTGKSGLHWVAGFLSRQPFLLLFATMAAGFAIAKVKVRDITLGATAGTLLVGLGLSLWASARHGVTFQIPDFASAIFFDLFMFAIGMKVGPQFIAGLNRGAKAFVVLGLAVPLLSAAVIWLVRLVLNPPYGMTAGIFAGANTASPGLGAATAAFTSGSVALPSGIDQAQAVGNMSTAFAFSYCISVVLFVVMLKALPRLSGRDPIADARRFEREMGAGAAPLPGTNTTFLAGSLPVERRTYRVDRPDLIGTSLGELRAAYPFVDVEAVRRDGQALPLSDETTLARSDEVTVFGRVARLLELVPRVGPEVIDPDLEPLELETAEIVQQNDAVVGKTLGELAAGIGHGIHLNAMFRAGEEIPRGGDVVVRRGDVMRVTATPKKLAAIGEIVGAIVRPSLSTDVLTLAIGLAIGAFVGALTLRFGSIQLSLGSVALLLTGVLISTLRTRNPTLGGPFPEPARQLLEDLGLNVFVAVLGLNAGAGVIEAVRGGALVPIAVGTICAGLVPPLVAWWVGLKVFAMNTAELMGAVAGARCASPGLRAAQEATESTAPAIAYPVTFAISNVVLTLASYVFALVD